ncbi:hypothetical protein HanRHA438_Chr11g0529711 [Helianthus annuus]|nr:hypothetical protein HanXRQr2_Chr11g0518081 [Helianthus annuus]KAJ0511868.1 hypothetical protein HanIR_Chr11g0556861 [Helianthus annuus]KAJ0519478.1 hypothetical protein HanHA89_Chr11g0449171 [Helianthus annuus]KAJ0872964.1 hypothetical protein HanRHA438_Chr11g0529711 [Helianthus annuus]KAJ0877362.1 hypothetical protein HanPSC8_Chr11g0499261 [Helianthus annuus]
MILAFKQLKIKHNMKTHFQITLFICICLFQCSPQLQHDTQTLQSAEKSKVNSWKSNAATSDIFLPTLYMTLVAPDYTSIFLSPMYFLSFIDMS